MIILGDVPFDISLHQNALPEDIDGKTVSRGRVEETYYVNAYFHEKHGVRRETIADELTAAEAKMIVETGKAFIAAMGGGAK